MSVIEVVQSATLVTKVVLFMLFVMSIFSWAVILSEYVVLRRLIFHVTAINRRISGFSSVLDIGDYLKKCVLLSVFIYIFERSERICKKAFSNQQPLLPSEIMMPIRICADDEVSKYVSTIGPHVSYLGMIGSVAPYIGLLGTVWGIVSAFHGFADLSRVTLSQVAPDISEALISTAASLVVAIPAVIAYSRLNLLVDELARAVCDFKEYFLLQLYTHLISGEYVCWEEQDKGRL
ncbi:MULTISPECIES: MotA/TolQ/ExbB proton channel family protein [Candidatus Ichthyocystis]|uniref:MotA/TolQ/ExbB proton channel family protein n=1 Tax=Candidatus Ichthyocystis TaxID=2929841 RepID=UPI000B899447|nr:MULTISPECIES: MotA/TolQ/ExbB proton channel family protein [Ichthyocystis]